MLNIYAGDGILLANLHLSSLVAPILISIISSPFYNFNFKPFFLLLILLVLNLASVAATTELPAPLEAVVPVNFTLFTLNHMLMQRNYLLGCFPCSIL